MSCGNGVYILSPANTACMENRKDVTVPIEESMVEEIHEQLDYGDSRAGWIRGAIKQRLIKEMDE